MKRMTGNSINPIDNRAAPRIVVCLLALAIFAFGGCSLVKEGITGEKPIVEDEGSAQAAPPSFPAAFDIIGDWFGVYGGSEYLALRFTADGKCEMQPAQYASDMFGPRYYGEYRWGGEDGKDIVLDLYKGASREVDYGGGNIWDEWYDSGREGAATALNMAFAVYGGKMKSVALKAGSAGIDTDGYAVVQAGAFLVLLSENGQSGNPSPFVFGTPPGGDPADGKNRAPAIPDTFAGASESFETTEELNVRCGPDTDYETYGTIPKATPVDKIGNMASGHEDWVFVLLQDGGGWVNTGYLAAPGTAAAAAADEAAPAAAPETAGE